MSKGLSILYLVALQVFALISIYSKDWQSIAIVALAIFGQIAINTLPEDDK